jgi:hypothetical protein
MNDFVSTGNLRFVLSNHSALSPNDPPHAVSIATASASLPPPPSHSGMPKCSSRAHVAIEDADQENKVSS